MRARGDVRCPLCRHAPAPDGTCPDCGQDLAPLARLDADAAVQYNRALALAADGADDDAVHALHAALAADPGLADAWVVLGKLHARGGRVDEARRALLAARRTDDAHAGARSALEALGEAGDPASASGRERGRRWPVVLAAALGALAGGLAVAAVTAGTSLYPAAPRRYAPP